MGSDYPAAARGRGAATRHKASFCRAVGAADRGAGDSRSWPRRRRPHEPLERSAPLANVT